MARRTRIVAGAASVALNGLAVMAVAGLGSAAPDRSWVEPPAMEVSLVAVAGRDAPPAETPPPERREPAPNAATSPPPTPTTTTPMTAAAPAEPVVHRASTPGPAALTRQAAAQPRPAGDAAASGEPRDAAPPLSPPRPDGAPGGLDIDAPAGLSADYASRLRAWLEAHKTYPRRSRLRREEGIVHLQFSLDRHGRLLAGDIVRSSGFAALDAEALAMLGRADPFPRAPKEVRGERIEISTPVQFELPL